MSNNMFQEDRIQTENNEINLIDFIRVISKRKFLILGFLLAGLIMGGALTFFSPTTHTAKATIEIGELEGYITKTTFLISPYQVLKKILESPYQAVEKIKGGVYGNYPEMKISNPSGTVLLQIEIVSEDSELARKSLEDLTGSILEDHNNKMNSEKAVLEEKIKKLQERIDFLFARGKETEVLELEVCNLEQKIGSFQPTKVINDSVTSKEPNLIFNLICSGSLGIFLGGCLVFGKEWWEENKRKL